MNNQKGEEIKRLNKELSSFKDNKNQEIKNLNNEVNNLKNKLNELEEKYNNMKYNYNDMEYKYDKVKKHIDEVKKHTDIIDIKIFYFREINAEEVKKNYKNSEFFKDIMNKYYSHISFLNSNWFFLGESRFKGSYSFICDYIFEELNEKNGKNCDKILEFDIPYTNYSQSNFNCLYLRNTIHQLFYSDLYGTDEEIFNKICDKIHEFLKLKEIKHVDSHAGKAKSDIREYFNTFKIFDIITLYKKLILE